METELFARKCSCCGDGMNSGYVVDGGREYYCSEECLKQNYTMEEWLLMTSYDNEEEYGMYHYSYNYWTEWEDEDDYEYELINGKLIERDI